ncbi:hypothetical protein AB205_0188130 [Aquarana catesbeiana]|uniref:Uncharacterized protein n=1 Tax=Aquarana catesbeiana TaxID=8400 RepID=A0A2G9QET8_AQUCT|nr:hypothetical protein AB205_0188130 [Aquarana catesbeiana]
MFKVIFDKSSTKQTADSVSDNTAPTLAEIQAIEDLLTLLEEGDTGDECLWEFDNHGIVASGVSFPPPLSFKPKSTNFPNLSANPNIWAFVEQIKNTVALLGIKQLSLKKPKPAKHVGHLNTYSQNWPLQTSGQGTNLLKNAIPDSSWAPPLLPGWKAQVGHRKPQLGWKEAWKEE